MMLVIADTSPLILLVTIGHIEILPRLFGRVAVPPAVVRELSGSSRSEAVQDWITSSPEWLEIRQPQFLLSIPKLHAGETEALSLAVELHADLLLVDERRAFKEAVSRNINAVGTIRVLERAAAEGMLELADAFAKVKHTDFWISHKLLDARLAMYQQGRE